MSDELSTTEMYALAQILVCGEISEEEFKDINKFMGQVQDSAITGLNKKGYLKETLMTK